MSRGEESVQRRQRLNIDSLGWQSPAGHDPQVDKKKVCILKLRLPILQPEGKDQFSYVPLRLYKTMKLRQLFDEGETAVLELPKKKNTALTFHLLILGLLRYILNLTVSLTNPVPHSYCGRTCNKCPTADPRRDPMNRGILFGSCFILFSSHVWCIIFTKLLEQETACKHCSTDRQLVAECCSKDRI